MKAFRLPPCGTRRRGWALAARREKTVLATRPVLCATSADDALTIVAVER